MNKKITSLIIVLLITLLLLGVTGSGCVGDMEQFQGLSSSSEFSVVLVPNINLDVYVYAKQKSYTRIPAEILNMSHDFDVESMALWGVSGSNNTYAFGMGLTFIDEATASDVFNRIKMDANDGWKFQRSNNIYIVKGTGTPADSIKRAITNNDFKQYNNQRLIEASAMLPKSVRAKLIGMALAKPSKELLQSLSANLKLGNLEQIDQILKVANLEMIIAGLYSPHSINTAKAMEIYKQGGAGFSSLELGLLVFVKSALPGILVGPRVKSLMIEQGFAEAKIGEITIYKAKWKTNGIEPIYAVARVEDNYIFMAVSGQENYAETLITGIYK